MIAVGHLESTGKGSLSAWRYVRRGKNGRNKVRLSTERKPVTFLQKISGCQRITLFSQLPRLVLALNDDGSVSATAMYEDPIGTPGTWTKVFVVWNVVEYFIGDRGDRYRA